MTNPNASNSVPAEALSPELISVEQGYQTVRLPLRTETGTIVYADLGHGEAEVLANRIGRLAYGARENNNKLRAAAENVWPQPGSLAEKLVTMVRREGGVWTEARFAESTRRIGADLSLMEAAGIMRELADHGALREVGIGRYATVR